MNKRDLRVLWADSTFEMRTWAKYSIGLLVVLYLILLETWIDVLENVADYLDDRVEAFVDKSHPFMERLFSLIYK